MSTAFSSDPTFDLKRATTALHGAAIGHTLVYQTRVSSTMVVAQQLAEDPAVRSGTVVLAEEQQAGLGRLQRRWEAPPGQALLASLILKRGQLPDPPAQLPMIAGVAAARAIAALVPGLTDDLGLKWPNDLMLGEDLAHARKCGGVLIETVYVNGQIEYAIVGFGINVNQEQADLPSVPPQLPQPTSLRLAAGRQLDRTDLLVALCRAWDELSRLAEPAHDLYHEWRSLLLTLGQPVSVLLHQSDRTLQGVALDVTMDGALLLVDEAGHLHRLDAGDVTTRLP
ncbi:MAG: biotin--[acetyl-CoA-carboxylase] ligase [Caldilinea sp.]